MNPEREAIFRDGAAAGIRRLLGSGTKLLMASGNPTLVGASQVRIVVRSGHDAPSDLVALHQIAPDPLPVHDDHNDLGADLCNRSADEKFLDAHAFQNRNFRRRPLASYAQNSTSPVHQPSRRRLRHPRCHERHGCGKYVFSLRHLKIFVAIRHLHDRQISEFVLGAA